jgi:hypothetical protein
MFPWPIGRNPSVLVGEGLDPCRPAGIRLFWRGGARSGRSGRGGTRSDRSGWGMTSSRPTSWDPALLDGEQVAITWLEDWLSVESGEDLAVADSRIRRWVAEQVVGLKPIGLFENEKILGAFYA